MTHRQRIQRILDGGVPDRTVWAPRLDLWYNAHRAAGTLPESVRNLSLRQTEAFLGMAHSARAGVVHRLVYDGVEEITIQRGPDTIRTFRTPIGETSATYSYSAEAHKLGVRQILTEHYIKTERDYEVMQYVAEHMRFEADYERYLAYDTEVGEDGYPLVVLGPSPVDLMMIIWLGYEKFYLDLADFPQRIENLLAALEAGYRKLWDVVASSPARYVMHGVHFSGQMTPPPIFKRYFLPYFRAFNERMHRAGIKVAFHADADLTGLLELVAECGFDVADTLATAPLVSLTFDEARRVWKDRVVIWGGVPSTILEESYPRADFCRYIEELHAKTVGRPGFIMAVSDNIMPGASFDRLLWIRDFLHRSG